MAAVLFNMFHRVSTRRVEGIRRFETKCFPPWGHVTPTLSYTVVLVTLKSSGKVETVNHQTRTIRSYRYKGYSMSALKDGGIPEDVLNYLAEPRQEKAKRQQSQSVIRDDI